MIFMLIYYHGAGINADLALILNLVILLGFMGFSKATLTLPGIAGVILTLCALPWAIHRAANDTGGHAAHSNVERAAMLQAAWEGGKAFWKVWT